MHLIADLRIYVCKVNIAINISCFNDMTAGKWQSIRLEDSK